MAALHALLGALLGGFIGALYDNEEGLLLGLLLGAWLGLQGGRLRELRQRVAGLESAAAATGARPAAPVVATSAADPRPAPEAASEAPAAPAAGQPAVAAREATAASTTTPAAASATSASPPPDSTRDWRSPPDSAPPPSPPGPPGLGDRLLALLRRALFEGNVPVKLGALVLLFGVAAALRYAVDAGWLRMPIEFRLAGIALAAVVALAWGFRSRVVRPTFGLVVQGLAIGVLLLTSFAAYRLYGLLPAGAAFALVLVLVAGAALLALLQNAVWLALIGLLGGYAAPVLISTGSGNHVALFSFYAVLNAAVLAIAWVRPWRALNLLGFVFTFGVGTLWGAQYYRPEHLATVQPFLALFFAFFLAIPVLYALRQAPTRRGLVDGTLVFGTPLVCLGLQAALLADRPMQLAYVSLGVAAVYAALAWWLLRRHRLALFGNSFAVLAVGFATLAIPLALSMRWTGASFAIEGAALVWLGLRQQRRLPQVAGWILQVLAGVAWLAALLDRSWRAPEGELALLNGHFLGLLLMSASALFIGWCHERHNPHRLRVWPPFLLGLFWWGMAGLRELDQHFGEIDERLGVVGFAALTLALAGGMRSLTRWPRLGFAAVFTGVASVPLAFGLASATDSVLRWPAAGFWLVLFAAGAFALTRLREPLQRGISVLHIALLVSLALALGGSLETEARLADLGSGWRYFLALAPGALLLALAAIRPRLAGWPVAAQFAGYRMGWLQVASVGLGLLWCLGLGETGDSAPLPYLPLLNPLELMQAALLLGALAWVRTLQRQGHANAPAATLLVAIAGFAFLTQAGLRAVHQFDGAPWSLAILDSGAAQATLSLVWSVAGVAAWVLGSRRGQFGLWLAGALLMALVLGKLVLVDRQYMGNLAGIVSFLAVGGLLVLVGRLAPSPPRRGTEQATP